MSQPIASSETDRRKLAAARKALEFIRPGETLGVGSGSTVNFFIGLLAEHKGSIPAVVAASTASEQRLREAGLQVISMEGVASLGVYVDGADEIDPSLRMIKGGGAALTREKIIAQAADSFVCVVDASKRVERLGRFPLPIEVIPFARASVIRRLESMGGAPVVRPNVHTDNGNLIIDVTGLDFGSPEALEERLNQIPGVVCNGVFARRAADVCITAGEDVTVDVR